MRNLWQVSWRNLTRNKKRFFFTLISIISGIIFTTSMLINDRTTQHTFEYYANIYTGNADLWVLGQDHTFTSDEVKSLAERAEIADALYVLDKQTFVELEDRQDPAVTSVRISGVSSPQSELLVLPLIDGDLDREGLILPENAARLWNKKVGDTVTFRDMGTIEVTAIVSYNQLLASPDSWEAAKDRHFRVMMPLRTLQEWTGLENEVSYVRFQAVPQADKDELVSAFQQELRGSPLFVQPVVIDDKQNNDVEGLTYIFYLVAILALFISGFIVFNMIFASVTERRKEFSIMKSLGYTNMHIYRLVLTEVLLLSFTGTLIGVPIGIWFADLFQQMLLSIFRDTVDYTLQWQGPVMLSILVGICFPVVAALVPMYIAGKTPILQAMRNQQGNLHSGHRHLRWILGLIMLFGGFIDHMAAYLLILVAAVLLFPYLFNVIKKGLLPVYGLLMGYPGTMACGNVSRHLNRNSNTAAMLASSVSVVIFMGAALQTIPNEMEREIRQTYGGDIQARSERPWTTEEISRIASLEGVRQVGAYREAMVTWENIDREKRNFNVLSFHPEADPKFQKFKAEADLEEQLEKAKEPGTILLGKRAFDEWGGKVGESLTVNTPNGRDQWKVVGVVETSHYNGYTGFVHESFFSEGMNWPHIYHLMIDAGNNGGEAIREQLWQQYGDRLSKVSTVDQAVASSQKALSGMNELMKALLILVIALSSIGISNTLLMNMMERIAEIGTIRATGFTGSQVRRMVIGEGLLVGISGIAIGMILGIMIIYLNSVSVSVGNEFQFIIPWDSLAFSALAGLALSTIASWLPASFATRINIQQALKHE
ncbi:ABC transporter permease [Paenibacillus sp. J2TS4]|uniref:ABC transporter permease n=1 Tax=Paenibacillus sp. J2TS4 TaxID=2807194 RepID=UPI001B116CE4|nr:FtsX-like permease family protein [Paenibacillus sp. J2TS4]GIP35094.1 hypothetical protein J2TS4_43040 [Paenibacillus sp. J2TS4]